jgi:formylglycine-generating enzyme required for sulfatase activity
LPTEAEWEYACRAGAATMFAYGVTDELLGKYGWFVGNAVGKSHCVGLLRPNDFGLFDMHGNAWEWCHNAYTQYHKNAGADVIGDIADKEIIVYEKTRRVLRGGSFDYDALYLRCGYRNRNGPGNLTVYIGLRPARTFR